MSVRTGHKRGRGPGSGEESCDPLVMSVWTGHKRGRGPGCEEEGCDPLVMSVWTEHKREGALAAGRRAVIH